MKYKYANEDIGSKDARCSKHPNAKIVPVPLIAPGYAWGCKECFKITYYLALEGKTNKEVEERWGVDEN
jgi:hypothetical protein